MTIIGITGPTGAGKTTALNEVEKLGGAVIDCDAVYHQLLESDLALQNKLEAEFGPLRGTRRGASTGRSWGPLSLGTQRSWSSLNAIAQTATVDRTRQLLEEHRRARPACDSHRRHRPAGERPGGAVPLHHCRGGSAGGPGKADHGPGGHSGGLRLVPGPGPEGGRLLYPGLRLYLGQQLRPPRRSLPPRTRAVLHKILEG